MYTFICTQREYYFNGFRSAYTLKGHSVIPAIILIFSRRNSKIIVEERTTEYFYLNTFSINIYYKNC